MNNELKVNNENNLDHLKEALLKSIMYCYSFTGYKSETADIGQQVITMIGVLRSSEYRTLTIEGIRIAFKKGVELCYGEYMGLNCLTYTNWIREYLSEKVKSNGQLEHERVRLRISQPKTLSQKELDEISEANFKFVLEHFKKTGEVKDYGGACFLYLWRIKKLRFDDEKSKEYIRRAEQIEHMRLTEELENAKAKLDKIAKNQIETELDELLEGKKTVNTIARELALADYLLTI